MRHLQCFLTVISTIHFHVVLFQTETDSLHDQLLIIHYQHFLACHLSLTSLSLTFLFTVPA